jgi:hypothetical protein
MNRVTLTFAILTIICFATPAAAAIITFDDLMGQAPVPDGYGGVNWGGVWTHYDFAQPPYNPHSDPQRIYSPNSGPGEYQFAFVIPNQTFGGAWFSGQESTSVFFNLYDDAALVASSPVLFTSSVPTFLSAAYSGPVDVVGIFSNANDFYVMDDVTVGTDTPVPEPATFLLVGTGLLGVSFRKRFRRME